MGTAKVTELSVHPRLYCHLVERMFAWTELRVFFGRLSVRLVSRSTIPPKWLEGALLETLGPGPKLAARVCDADLVREPEIALSTFWLTIGMTLVTEPLGDLAGPNRKLPTDTRIMLLGRTLSAQTAIELPAIKDPDYDGSVVPLMRRS